MFWKSHHRTLTWMLDNARHMLEKAGLGGDMIAQHGFAGLHKV
jgi:hypothetical protein